MNFENWQSSYEGRIYLEYIFFGCNPYKCYYFLAAMYEIPYSREPDGEKDLSFQLRRDLKCCSLLAEWSVAVSYTH